MVPRHQNQTNTPTEILMGFTQGIVCAHMHYFLQAHVITTIIAFRLPGKLLYMLMLWATWDMYLCISFIHSVTFCPLFQFWMDLFGLQTRMPGLQ